LREKSSSSGIGSPGGKGGWGEIFLFTEEQASWDKGKMGGHRELGGKRGGGGVVLTYSGEKRCLTGSKEYEKIYLSKKVKTYF